MDPLLTADTLLYPNFARLRVLRKEEGKGRRNIGLVKAIESQASNPFSFQGRFKVSESSPLTLTRSHAIFVAVTIFQV